MTAADRPTLPAPEAVVDEALADLEPVDLATVEAAASLTRRFDDKFLVDVDTLDEVVVGLGGGWSVLEVDTARATRYSSTYFDTADLLTYRHHLQGRRRRYKVRTRRYGDSGPHMVEVKLKGSAGRTEKARWERDARLPEHLTADELDRVHAVLADTYGWPPPDALEPSLTTNFTRSTLVEVRQGQRITIDTGLVVEGRAGGAVRFDSGLAVVEVKGARRASDAFRLMMRLGHRPMPVSKYCLGVVSLHPGIRGNPWRPTLRRLGVRGASEPTIARWRGAA